MSLKLIESLNLSLRQLEEAINKTKTSFARIQGAKKDIIHRLDCYTEVLGKQKILVQSLHKSIADQNWQQVSRTVELIKGSSLLIQLDTQAIISEIASKSKPEEIVVN